MMSSETHDVKHPESGSGSHGSCLGWKTQMAALEGAEGGMIETSLPVRYTLFCLAVISAQIGFLKHSSPSVHPWRETMGYMNAVSSNASVVCYCLPPALDHPRRIYQLSSAWNSHPHRSSFIWVPGDSKPHYKGILQSSSHKTKNNFRCSPIILCMLSQLNSVRVSPVALNLKCNPMHIYLEVKSGTYSYISGYRTAALI